VLALLTWQVALWGRFGLPIMYRVPILGVMGEPIHVPKVSPRDRAASLGIGTYGIAQIRMGGVPWASLRDDFSDASLRVSPVSHGSCVL
jgi:hypothetical protein